MHEAIGRGSDRSASTVRGEVAIGFEAVREQFTELLAAEGHDLDAQLAAYHRGRKVVDLWAGPDIRPDSILGIYSATKGVAHVIVALLVQDGVLDLDRPVSYYWPEFGCEGKKYLLLRELLAHQAGLVGTADGFAIEELIEDRLVARRLSSHRPFWRPGRVSGYHALVMAELSAEVVRRATGRTVQEHFAERLQAPLHLDLYLGLPEEQDHRFLPALPMTATPERRRELAAVTPGPDSLAGIAFNRHHPDSPDVWELPNFRSVRSRGTASFGGIGSARSLAKLYSALVSPVGECGPLLTSATASTFGQIQSAGTDVVLRQHKAWAVGFHAYAEMYPVLGAGAFGHSGAGGQQALVDPRSELSYAFLRRRFLVPSQADNDHLRLLDTLVDAANHA